MPLHGEGNSQSPGYFGKIVMQGIELLTLFQGLRFCFQPILHLTSLYSPSGAGMSVAAAN